MFRIPLLRDECSFTAACCEVVDSSPHNSTVVWVTKWKMAIFNKITMESRPIGNPAYAVHEDACGWTALVNLDLATGIALNETGLMVWRAVDGKRTAEEIIAKVKDCFCDVPSSIGEDVMAVLAVLNETGLVGFEVAVGIIVKIPPPFSGEEQQMDQSFFISKRNGPFGVSLQKKGITEILIEFLPPVFWGMYDETGIRPQSFRFTRCARKS